MNNIHKVALLIDGQHSFFERAPQQTKDLFHICLQQILRKIDASSQLWLVYYVAGYYVAGGNFIIIPLQAKPNTAAQIVPGTATLDNEPEIPKNWLGQ